MDTIRSMEPVSYTHLQHGLKLSLGHAGRPIKGEARSQAHPDRRVLIIGGPCLQHLIGHPGILHDGRRRLQLGGLGVGAEGTAAGAAHQALFIREIDVALIGAALGNILEGAVLGGILRRLTGQSSSLHQELSHLASGHSAVCGVGSNHHSKGQGCR